MLRFSDMLLLSRSELDGGVVMAGPAKLLVVCVEVLELSEPAAARRSVGKRDEREILISS